MLRGLWSAASGMSAQKMTIDVIANNLANVNSTGFKKSTVDFQDLMYQTTKMAGAATADGGQIPTGIQVGMGTMPLGVHKLFMQGDFKQTGSELDLSIEGKGFFRVISSGEERYSRSGNFKLDAAGNIVTANGDRLQPEMSVPANSTSIHVDQGGTVTTFDAEGVGAVLGVIELYTFANPAGLHSTGRNLYRASDASGEPTPGTPGLGGVGTIVQGALEMSNVDVVEEMVSMIMAQRAYEINSKAIQTADSMMQLANNIKR